MMQRPSDSEERQLILSFDVLHMILFNYLEKDQDILSFILASKLYYEQFHGAFLLQNVFHGKCTALERAARDTNMAMVGKILEIPLIEAAVPPNVWLRMADIAIDLKHVDLMRSILQVNCVRTSINEEANDIAIKGPELKTMWHAIQVDQADLVELYLSHGMTVELCDPAGSTALQYKADPNKIFEPVVISSYLWDAPLTLAAEQGSTKLIKLLLEHKANPCYGEAEKFCQALGVAVSDGHKDVVKILLQDERIELNARDIYGMTIMGYAVRSGNTDMVSPLLIAAQGVGFDAVGRPDTSGLAMTKLLLLDRRVDIYLKDNYERTALFRAAVDDQHEVLKMYLDGGKLDPNATDKDLLTLISETRNENCLELLINDTRVDLSVRNAEGKTPLMHSVSFWRVANVGRLLDLERVDVNQADNEGNTAMMKALQLMLNSGRVKLDMVNAKGETALMVAVKSQAAGAVEMILATGHRMTDSRQIVELLLGTGEVQVVQRTIEIAQLEFQDMLMRYRDAMEERAGV
ncbi:putative ankyrin repeat protein [Trichoderma evansii]